MDIDAIKEKFATAQRFFVLTGAGLGVASGLSTFRGTNGMYLNRTIEFLASRSGFEIDPETSWEWYNLRIEAYLAATPNAGHTALVEMERRVPRFDHATQNVDGLIWRAGAQNAYEIHGNLRFARCTYCAYREPLEGPFDTDRLIHEGCGGKLRPNVVWFGENLPEDLWTLAAQAGAKADVIIVAGTSGTVFPAANLARRYEPGAVLIEINPEPTLCGKADLVLAEGTETGLPRLVDLLSSP